MSICKRGGALYSLNSVWPIFHFSSSFKRKMTLCLLLIRKEDNKCIVLFQFFPARGFLPTLVFCLEVRKILNRFIFKIKGSVERRWTAIIWILQICVQWTDDENNLINSTSDFMGYNQGWFTHFLSFLPNHCLHYLAFFWIQRKAIWTTTLFMFTAKSGNFLHSRFEREFTAITGIQGKTASTVNDKQFSHIIYTNIIGAIQLKYRSKISKYAHNLHTTAVPLANRVRIAVHLLQIDPEQR